MRKIIVLVVTSLFVGVIGACAARSVSENDQIAACQSKGGRWKDEACSGGYCELPTGASPSTVTTQTLGADDDWQTDDSAVDGDAGTSTVP